MAKIVKNDLIFGGTPKEFVTAWPYSENGIETIEVSNIKDITSTVTVSSYCRWAHVYQMDKLILVSALLNAGVPDQTVIISNMPDCLFATAGNVFYMNAEDAGREMSAYQMGTSLQFRTLTTTTGSGGALVSIWYIAK